jgi:DNA-binding response OmpR family regulator
MIGHSQRTDRRKILIVEDEAEMARALTVRLQSAGYDTLTAPDGLRAQTTAHAVQPDLVLLDIGLPLADGFEVFAGLRARTETTRIPVVFLTARTWESARANAVNPDGYLTKPYRSEDLLALVDRLTDRCGAQSRTAAASGRG